MESVSSYYSNQNHSKNLWDGFYYNLHHHSSTVFKINARLLHSKISAGCTESVTFSPYASTICNGILDKWSLMRYSLGCYYEWDAPQSSSSVTSASKLSCFLSSTSLVTYKRLRPMPSKSGRNGRPFPPRSIHYSAAQSQHHYQNCGYTSFLTCCSNCLDHYAT